MKALLLSMSFGEGHNSTAKSLCAYLESMGFETEMLDTIAHLSHLIGDTVSKGYLKMASDAKFVYKGAYRLAEKRNKSNSDIAPARSTANLVGRKLLKYINSYDPDVIICTHVFPSIILDLMKERGELRAKTVGIVTDFMFHPYWEEATHLDYVVVPSEQMMCQAKKKGFAEAQVIPMGIPINPKFAQRVRTKEQARAELGLDINKRTVLFMSGGAGFGDIKQTVKEIDAIEQDFQLITVCGSNIRAKARIDRLKTKKRILNLGFVDYIDKLMDAADCIITKPGGLTSSEALAKSLPMILVNPVPGQEDRNLQFLTNNGVAMSASSTAPIDDVLYQLLADPRRVEVMRQAVEIIAKPDSTRNICEFVKSICESVR